MQFEAEIKETKQIKKSLDNEYGVKFITNDPSVLQLGALPPDITVKVEVSWEVK